MADGISVSLETLQEKYNAIKEIDNLLDAASGNENAGKTAVGNELMRTNEVDWKGAVDQLVEFINGKTDTATRVGIYTGIRKSLYDQFHKDVDTFLSEEAKKRQVDAPKVSDDEVQLKIAERKELLEQYRALRNILDMFEQDVDSVPVPSSRVGARGKRGPQVLRGYNFYINGKARGEGQNTLSSIAATVCAKLDWSTADLKSFISNSGIDLENPPETFEVTLPAPVNKVLRGDRGVSTSAEDEEVDEEEEEEENGTTEDE